MAGSRPALLDVNVLVALFDPDHVHHEPAHCWLAANRERGWATCPLTENGLVRILANPAYSGVHESVGSIRDRLATFCRSGNHLFWSDDASLRDESFRMAGVGHRQLTDVYLLGLAARNGGRLASFDRSIPVGAVAKATASTFELIPA